MIKRWKIHKPEKGKIKLLANEGGLPEIAAEILSAAGFDDFDSASEFFGDGNLSDPFSIIDMQEARDAIEDIAFENGDRVCVYGDYDCDGICAAAILYTFFLSNGADVTYHINSRVQGFGLNETVIRELQKDGVKLIITVDNGIAAIKEAELIKKLDMELIVTDHHIPGEELPKAIAVVDPHRADNKSCFVDYCGAGVALMLVAALMEDTASAMEEFSDIAALATVADMVPLTGDNRSIVIKGLRYLEHSENLGLRALIDVSDIKPPFSPMHMGFMLAPRINSANRVAHAREALELLLCEDPDEAVTIAKKINGYNSERKNIQAHIKEAVCEYINTNADVLYDPVICIYIKDAHDGVIGLAAGDIQRATGKPCYLCTDDENGLLKGSARCAEGYSITDSFIRAGDLLTKSGGHHLAGGFSLKRENFEAFKNVLFAYAKSLPAYDNIPVLEIAKIMDADSLKLDNISEIDRLEPFGKGFPRPLFLLPSAVITEKASTKNGDYLSLSFTFEDQNFKATVFEIPLENFGFFVGDRVDIVTYLGISSWSGKETIDFNIQDIRLSGLSQAKQLSAYTYYEKFRRGEELTLEIKKSVLPSQAECETINNQIKNIKTGFTITQLTERNASVMNGFKLRIILDAFEEAGRIKIDRYKDTIKILHPKEIIRITSTPTMKRLQ
ncbi:MAG: single-stranded-DNA-specific exonuclease RecJ [Ruminococcus sp.]|jgi:single-stranded-DNA-specific exonuclease|nr:single-stranded-DNA-specific exonuclease RecJ [Ruminococcus sp.]